MPVKPDFGNMLGHGRLGIRSGLYTFKDLLDQSASNRHILAQVQPVLTVTGWSLSASNTYVAPFDYNYGGVRRDVVSVSAIGDVNLTRAETSTLSSGQYYYEPNEVFTQEVFKWDQSDGRWQIAAWKFDGSTDYWTTSGTLKGIADGKEITLSFWIETPSENPSAVQDIIQLAGGRFLAYIATNGYIYVVGKNTSNTVILNVHSGRNLCDGAWHYVIATCNLGDTDAQMYADGIAGTAATNTNEDIDLTNTNWAIGATTAGASFLAGSLGQIWFLDSEVGNGASDSVMRDLFYNSTDSRPVDLPLDGKVTTGGTTYTPLVYTFDIEAAANNGTGGTFTDQGTTIEATTRPIHAPAIKWDQFPQLYVNLTDDSNPSDTTVVAHLGFHFATKAQSHPTLGDDIFSGNGDFESFSGGVPVGWTAGSGDGTIAEETSDPWKGDKSVQLSLAGAEGNDWKFIKQVYTTPVDGGNYRLSGFYKTSITDPGSATTGFAKLKIRDSSATSAIASDGRSIIGNTTIELTNTGSYWRFFCWDFYWDAGSLPNDMQVELFVSGANSDVDVYFDDVQLRRIWRYEFYEPRLTQSAIPATSSGSNDIFFGGKRTSTGNIGFLNQDKFWEVAGGQLEWINQKSTIIASGQFMSEPTVAGSTSAYTEGQEILFNDMRTAYSGLIQGIKISDDKAELTMQDVRTYFHIKLPTRIYTDTDFANLNTTDWQGKVRPVFFGAKKNITPIRIAFEATSGTYGQYEICDTTDAPNGIKAIDTIYAYTSKTAADLKDSNERLTLVENTDYTTDLANGRFDIDLDVGPYKLTHAVNNSVDFNDGADQVVWLTLASYTGATLAAEIQTKMDAESTDTITCTYSETTNKFTIASDGVTFSLLLISGVHVGHGVFSTIGFTANADKTGATSYLGDDATFTDAETNHVLRVDAQGYKDDGSGTYTGTASALIQTGADICRTILVAFMKRPSGSIDTTSFNFARTRAAETLALYINESISTKEIFERLEFSNIANIVIDGEGNVIYEVYVGAVGSNVTTIYDRDIQKFEAKKGYQDIYQTIRVLYDRDPSTKSVRTREASDTSVSVRLGRQELKEFQTYLKYSDNATSVANRMLTLSKQAARIITVSVLGGLLIDHRVGDKVRIERARALGSSGELKQEAFRILSIKKDYLKGLVTIDVTDDKVTVASQACVTSCQLFCENTCQLECEKNCQETCKLNCEVACETACQALCEKACQETCQLGCLQVACELTCKAGGCESVCQACEGAGCQTDCENNCQTDCELGCQTDCKLQGCQTICQQACQGACEISACQTACELGTSCQTTCQTGCQDPCELSCQDACELSCQDSCQTGTCEAIDEQVI